MENKYKILGSNGYSISDSRVITDKLGNVVDLSVNGLYVSIALYNKLHTVTKDWLYYLAYYKITLPKDKQHLINVFQFDETRKTKLHMETIFISTAVPISIVKDSIVFRIIPRFPNYALDASGTKLLDIESDTIINIENDSSENKYIFTTILDKSFSRSRSLMVHRLMAMAWCDNDNPHEKILVNHKNGLKNDCRAINLEWASHSENTKHAVDNNLRVDNISVKLKSYADGRIHKFTSTTDATSFVGRSRINISLTSLETNPFWYGTNGIYEVKRIDDKSVWLLDDKTLSIKNPSPLKRIVLDGIMSVIKTKQDLVDLVPHGTGSTVSENSTYASIIKELGKTYKEIIHEYDTETPRGSRVAAKRYLARNNTTNNIISGDTLAELIKITGVGKSSAQKSAANNGAYEFNGWVFKVDDDNDFSPLVDIANKKSTILCKTISGAETIAESMREAASLVGCDKKYIKINLDTNIPFRGYYLYSK